MLDTFNDNLQLVFVATIVLAIVIGVIIGRMINYRAGRLTDYLMSEPKTFAGYLVRTFLLCTYCVVFCTIMVGVLFYGIVTLSLSLFLD